MEARTEEIVVVAPDERIAGPTTPGMDRQQAIATEGVWAGHVRTEPGMVSGWHHHGEHDTVIYVLTGVLKMEFGPDGTRTVEARPGDFIFVPKEIVHRESNPTEQPAEVVAVRAGTGTSLVNLDGPA